MIAVLIATLVASAAPVDTVSGDPGSSTGPQPVAAAAPAPATPPPTLEPAPVPAPAPATAAAVGQSLPDTVYFAGGGRVRGQVLQDDPRAGIKLRLLDGSIRSLAPEEFTRVEYADGTVSRSNVSVPAQPPPPPARLEPAPAGPLDSVYFLAGGRVRGTVIEEHPVNGVRIRQLDGTIRTYPRDELARIEYADGTVSRRKAPPPEAPPAPPPPLAAAPPPTAPPGQPPPFGPRLHERSHPLPLYLTLGVGATFLGGDAESGQPMRRLFSNQPHVSSEVGLRFSPSFALGVYGDAGGGEVATPVREYCQTMGTSCDAMTGRIGLLARHTWNPLSEQSKWLSIGTGWEVGEARPSHQDQGSALFTYSGREYVRLGAGIDFRTSQALGVGIYGSFAWGAYDRYEDGAGVVSLARATHTTGQIGVRLILFP
jgi:hypothetical protein